MMKKMDMNRYETMLIIKPDLSKEKKEEVFKDTTSVIAKNNGKIINQQVWADVRKLSYPIKKYQDGTYYLLQFDISASDIVNLKQAWKLNEDILRFQILKIDVK